MAEYQKYPVRTTAGVTGHVLRKARFLDKTDVSLVRLDDGREFEAPASSLHIQPDGSFLLDDARQTAAAETLQPEIRTNGAGATPDLPAQAPFDRESSTEFVVEEALFSDDVGVERVPVNKLIDEPAQTRQEGEITVVPVMEEVLTVQRRLLLKEEIRITRKRREFREPRKVVIAGSEPAVIGSDGRHIRS